LSLTPQAGFAAEEPGVGVVIDYDPSGAPFPIRRKGQTDPMPANVGAVVQAGDQIDVPATASIQLLLSNDALVPYAGPGVMVVPVARPIGAPGRLLRAFEAAFHGPNFSSSGDWLTRGGDCGPYDEPEPIRVPILRAGAR